MTEKLFSLFESIIDKTRGSLDENLIEVSEDGTLSLKEDVYDFIIKTTDEFIYPVIDLDEFFLKGSSLTYQWRANTDIDTYLVVEGIEEEELEVIREKISAFNKKGINIPGTEHPLEFYMDNKLFDQTKADVIYDLIKNKFIKMPVSIAATLSDYWGDFLKEVSEIDIQVGELKRDIVDMNLLRDYLSDSTITKTEIDDILIDVRKKLDEVESDLRVLVDDYENIRENRHKSFDINLEDIKDYKSKNLLPGNVIFKLLQRYYYLQLLRDFKVIFKEFKLNEEENEGLKVKDVDELMSDLKDSFLEYEEQIFNEK